MKVKVYLLFFCLLLLTNIIKRDSYESSRTLMEGCYGLTYPYPKECKVILTMIDDREGNVVILASLKVSVSFRPLHRRLSNVKIFK